MRAAGGRRLGGRSIPTTRRSTSATWRCGPSRSSGGRRRAREPTIQLRQRPHRGREPAAGQRRSAHRGRRRRSARRARRCRCSAENVDVAQLDQLLLGDQRLAGRLNANATVSGDDERAARRRRVHAGAGRVPQFKFESLAGKVDYAGSGHERRRPAAADAAGVAHGEGLRAADAVPADAAGRRRRTTSAGAGRGDRPPGRQQPDRPRRRPGLHVVRDQRHRRAAGERQGDRLRLRPAPRRRDRHPGRRVRGPGARHRLHRPRHAHRSERRGGRRSARCKILDEHADSR